MKNLLIVCILVVAAGFSACNKTTVDEPKPVTKITPGTPGTETKTWYPVVESALENAMIEAEYNSGCQGSHLSTETPLYSGNFMWTKPKLYFGMVAQYTPDWKEVEMKYIPHCLDSPAGLDVLEVRFRDSVQYFYQDATATWNDGDPFP